MLFTYFDILEAMLNILKMFQNIVDTVTDIVKLIKILQISQNFKFFNLEFYINKQIFVWNLNF